MGGAGARGGGRSRVDGCVGSDAGRGGSLMGHAGAADNLVKLWKGNKVQTTFKGHTQAVRALAKLDAGVGDGQLFASAGNDG